MGKLHGQTRPRARKTRPLLHPECSFPLLYTTSQHFALFVLFSLAPEVTAEVGLSPLLSVCLQVLSMHAMHAGIACRATCFSVAPFLSPPLPRSTTGRNHPLGPARWYHAHAPGSRRELRGKRMWKTPQLGYGGWIYAHSVSLLAMGVQPRTSLSHKREEGRGPSTTLLVYISPTMRTTTDSSPSWLRPSCGAGSLSY